MGINRSHRITFEETADLYNEVRPEYPDELTEDVIRLAGLAPDARILEIGCGAGNATIGFAKRGYRLLGVELGEKLAGYARQRCRDYPKTVIVQSAFEEYELEPRSFDLAVSADAFHWIQPEVGYPKLIHALKPTGSIALIWQIESDPQTECSRALDDIFLKYAPDEHGLRHDLKLEWVENIIRGNLREYCGIEDVTVRTYNWMETCDADRFIKQLRTSSSLRGLDAKPRESLHAETRKAIHRFGGTVETPIQVVLIFAKPGVNTT